MNREELIEYLTDYQSRLIVFNAGFIRNYEKGNVSNSCFSKHQLLIDEIKEVSSRINSANKSDNFRFQTVTMMSKT